MEFVNIIVDTSDRIATITLNRPSALNSLSAALLAELETALIDIERDDEIDVVIVTAAGEKGFCAGMDLRDFEAGNTDLSATKRVLDKLEDLNKPTIAAITDGYCITGGLEFALSCDILVASDKAVFGDTHSRINVSGGGATARMPRLIGLMQAKYLIFTSQFIDAHEAKRLGLVIEVFPSAELLAGARAIAGRMLKQNQKILRKMKELLNRGWRTDLYGAWCLEEAECRRGMEAQMASGFRMDEAVGQARSEAGASAK